MHAGQVDAFMVGDRSAAHHIAHHLDPLCGTDPQFQAPISQQHAVACLKIGCQLGIATGCPFARPEDLLSGEHEALAVIEDAAAILERAQADFGALQIHEDGSLRVLFLGRLSHAPNAFRVLLMRAVRHVQSNHGDAAASEVPDGIQRIAGWPESSYDLGFRHTLTGLRRGHPDLLQRVGLQAARVGVELTDAFRQFLGRHRVFVVHPTECLLIQVETIAV